MTIAGSWVRLAALSSCALALLSAPAAAADKLVLMTSWYAQAEHGGFYQAKATGLYEKDGLDVTIRMGGPQVNSMQLMLAGEADVYSGYDFQTLSGVQQGLPLVTIAAVFQHDMNGLVTHPDVTGLGDLKNRPILMATSARLSWWPWLKTKYSLNDDQTKPYTFNLQPFLIDAGAVQQGYPTSEPFGLMEKKIPYNFYMFADQGYPPYGSALVTRTDVVASRPEVLRRFVHATMLGWKSYLADPAPGNVLIKADNAKMSDDQLAFAIAKMRELHIVDGGEAATKGIGIITEARWKADYDYMVSAGLLKPETDWHKAFTTRFIDDLRVMPE